MKLIAFLRTILKSRRLFMTPSDSGSRQAYLILKFGFTVAPILAGLDKFTNLLTNWGQYLSPLVSKIIPASTFMPIVGVIEIIAGILVAIKPRIAAYVVSVWLFLIIINLLTIPGYYDIALRDLGLALGALALGRLSEDYAV
jgi:uncharacterized membrane protein YphA (DoxX/SURF4 family)